MFKTNRQRGITLVIHDIIVNVFIQQVENREEEVLFTRIMQWCPMVDINDV